MNFCIISPANGLETYSTQSKTHLVLPHVRTKQYMNFYKERREAGDTIILDNGAYEGQLATAPRMATRIEFYQPQVVVCPDAFLKVWTITWNQTKRFLDEFYHRVSPYIEFLGIPNSLPGDMHGWYECCKHMLGDTRITWLGIPRNLYTHFGRQKEMRGTVAEVVKDIRPDIKLHAFGMADGSLEELLYCAKSGFFESCDSSAPVWRGWNGYELDNDVDIDTWRKKGTPVNFNARITRKGHHTNHHIIERNLKKVLDICHSTQNGLQDSLTPAVG